MEQHRHPRPRLLWPISFNVAAFFMLVVSVVARLLYLSVRSSSLHPDVRIKVILSSLMDSLYVGIGVLAVVRRSPNLMMTGVLILVFCLSISLPTNEDFDQDETTILFVPLVGMQVASGGLSVWLAVTIRSLEYELLALSSGHETQDPSLYQTMTA